MDNETAKIIAEQTIEISKLKKRNYEYNESLKNIHGIICSIGGPLNDNVLQYSNKQLKTFSRILDEIDSVR